MAHRHAIVARDHRAQRGELAHLRVAAGHVLKAGGHPERTRAQVVFEDRLHPRQLSIRRLAGAVADAGAAAQGAVAGQGGHVDVGRRPRNGLHPRRQAVGRRSRAPQRGTAAVLAEGDRGHPHRKVLRVRVVERIAVGVQVDESRRQHATAAFDNAQAFRLRVRYAADAFDAVAAHEHIGALPRLAAAVDQQHVAQCKPACPSLRGGAPGKHGWRKRACGACRHDRQDVASGPGGTAHRHASRRKWGEVVLQETIQEREGVDPGDRRMGNVRQGRFKSAVVDGERQEGCAHTFSCIRYTFAPAECVGSWPGSSHWHRCSSTPLGSCTKVTSAP